MGSNEKGASRRDFIKQAAVTAGAVGALSACGKGATSPAKEPGGSTTQLKDGLPITVPGYPFDRVQALVDGRVSIEGCSLTFQKGSIGAAASHFRKAKSANSTPTC
jgi:hypothetical protein